MSIVVLSSMDTMADIRKCVQHVTNCLQENGLTVSSYIHHLLCTKGMDQVRTSLVEQAADICQDLYNFLPARLAVLSWAISMGKKTFQNDVLECTQHGLQFNVKHATSAYLEGSFMQEAAGKMEKYAPNLWDLVCSLLVSHQSRRQAMPEPDVELNEVQPEREMDLGEFGGDDMNIHNSQNEFNNGNSMESNKKPIEAIQFWSLQAHSGGANKANFSCHYMFCQALGCD